MLDLATLILNELKNETGYECVPNMVYNEISQIQEAYEHIQCLPKKYRKVQFYLYYLRFFKFTMVTHPVGYHLDVFPKKKQSLENKTVFIGHDCNKAGRGGAGQTTFCWALLDWKS